MWIARLIPVLIVVLGMTTPAAARRSGEPGHYTIRCSGAECSDRYHYRMPRGESPRRGDYGRSRSSRY